METHASSWIDRIQGLQDIDAYREQHWEVSFAEYLELVRKNPEVIRSAYQRLYDMIMEYGTEALSRIPGVRLIGTAAEKVAVLSFVVDGVHAHDVGTILDLEGIAVRVGHHCAQPVMQHFRVPATARASLAIYNRREEIDRLAAGLLKVREVFP